MFLQEGFFFFKFVFSNKSLRFRNITRASYTAAAAVETVSVRPLFTEPDGGNHPVSVHSGANSRDDGGKQTGDNHRDYSGGKYFDNTSGGTGARVRVKHNDDDDDDVLDYKILFPKRI